MFYAVWSEDQPQICIDHIVVFLACKDFGRMFDHSFTACAFYFFEVEISSRTLIRLFIPGSAHSGSANWDNCGRGFPDKLRVSSFPDRYPHYAYVLWYHVQDHVHICNNCAKYEPTVLQIKCQYLSLNAQLLVLMAVMIADNVLVVCGCCCWRCPSSCLTPFLKCAGISAALPTEKERQR